MDNKLYRKFIISEDKKLLFYSGVIDVILTWFVHEYDPLKISNFYNNTVFVVGVYLVIFYFLIWMCICIHNELIEKRARTKIKQYVELSSYIKVGADIRDLIKSHCCGAGLVEYYPASSDYRSWHDSVYEKYLEVDPMGAEIWRTEENKANVCSMKKYGKDVADLLNRFEYKIEKLRIDVNHYRKIFDEQK